MPVFTPVYQFKEDLARKRHDLGADTLKVALTNALPNVNNAVLADITQISGGGYVAGGVQALQISCVQTGGILRLLLNDAIFTATGAMGPFQYAVLFNDTTASPLKPLIGWSDYGAPITLAATETFKFRSPSTGLPIIQ